MLYSYKLFTERILLYDKLKYSVLGLNNDLIYTISILHAAEIVLIYSCLHNAEMVLNCFGIFFVIN